MRNTYLKKSCKVSYKLLYLLIGGQHLKRTSLWLFSALFSNTSPHSEREEKSLSFYCESWHENIIVLFKDSWNISLSLLWHKLYVDYFFHMHFKLNSQHILGLYRHWKNWYKRILQLRMVKISIFCQKRTVLQKFLNFLQY